MRNRYNKKNKPSSHVAEAIGRNYSRLMALCYRGTHGNFDSQSFEDIFQEAVIFVIHDPTAAKFRTDEELIRHFAYRYRMIEFQIIQDANQLKETLYADYIQASAQTNEE